MLYRPGEQNPFIRIPETLVRLTPQPDFPAVDLSDNNADVFKYILTTDQGSEAHASNLEDYQRQIHLVATWALQFAGLKPQYSYNEYRAFTQGFATFEAMADSVRARNDAPTKLVIGSAYDVQTASRRAHELFIGDVDDVIEEIDGEFVCTTIEERERQIQLGNPTVDLTLGEMYATWQNDRPNTHAVIVETAPPKYSTMNEIHARVMGAQVAYALQSAA